MQPRPFYSPFPPNVQQLQGPPYPYAAVPGGGAPPGHIGMPMPVPPNAAQGFPQVPFQYPNQQIVMPTMALAPGVTISMPPRPPLMPSIPNVVVGTSVVKPPVLGVPGTWIPPNPLATTPLTLYIGKIPSNLEDSSLLKVLEACGKVQKWSRPTDAATGKSKLFGFCTFATGVSALRCNSVLPEINLAPYCPSPEGDQEIMLQVKAGSKEQAVLESLTQMGNETAAGQSSSVDLNASVRDAILRILAEDCGGSRVQLDDASSLNALAASKFLSSHAPPPTVPVLPSSSALMEIGSLEENDPNREKLVLSEIEKFRLRQAQRDKEVEAQRREKLKSRIELLKQKQEEQKLDGEKKEEVESKIESKKRVSSAAPLPAIPAKADYLEQEAKRRRKQEVLEMLNVGSGKDAVEQKPDASESIGATDSSIKVGIKLSSAPPKSKFSVNSTGLFGVAEESHAPRQIVPLDITDEERRLAQIYDPLLSSLSDENADAYLHGQPQLLAQSSSSNGAPKKLTERDLVDMIPANKNELYAYKVDWGAVEKHEIIDSSLRSWIVRKTVEYLGEEEATLTEFIINKLKSRCAPIDLYAELEPVLDDDAESFVLKLWRYLIFSVLKCTRLT